MPQTPHVETHFTSSEKIRDIVIGMCLLHLRHLIGDDGEQDDLPLQDLVVREVALEHQRHPFGEFRQEDAASLDAWRLDPLHFLEELLEGQPQFQEMAIEQFGPTMPVLIMRKTPAAIASGTQPPCLTLVMLELRNARSIPRNTIATVPTRQTGHRQRCLAKTQNNTVVMTMVPVTATPYAPPSAVEDPKPTTSTRHPIISGPFTSGM